jgi:hypothetical protein
MRWGLGIGIRAQSIAIGARVTLMVAERAIREPRRRMFVKGRYGNPAGGPPGSRNKSKETKGVVIFTTICVVILLAFYAYLAWYLFASS